MERLTNKREADQQRKNYERRLENGYPRNIPEERFLKLAAYEDTGLSPEDVKAMYETVEAVGAPLWKIKELWDAEQAGQLLRLPFIAMIERSLQDGVMKPQRDQTHNGRYAVVYRDPSKWKSPLIDICGTHYNTQQAEVRCAELHNKRKE